MCRRSPEKAPPASLCSLILLVCSLILLYVGVLLFLYYYSLLPPHRCLKRRTCMDCRTLSCGRPLPVISLSAPINWVMDATTPSLMARVCSAALSTCEESKRLEVRR